MREMFYRIMAWAGGVVMAVVWLRHHHGGDEEGHGRADVVQHLADRGRGHALLNGGTKWVQYEFLVNVV